MPATATVIVGAQFGDEGKGKIVDELVSKRRFGMVIRYNGGANAGHTVVIGDKPPFKLHQVPSGIFHPEVHCAIGNGAVVDLVQLVEELDMLAAAGISTKGFWLSGNAHVVMPWHPMLDRMAETIRGKDAIGTTGRGIGPCYEDKAARRGIRVSDLRDEALLRDKVEKLRAMKRRDLLRIPDLADSLPPTDEIIATLRPAAKRLDSCVTDVGALARHVEMAGEAILLEGAQGTMLDLEIGTYPNVSSSYATSAGACVGSGLSPRSIREVLCVAKAYVTRVGSGPFPTELHDETGERLRALGHEFGTTTGRPRRCGWFDAVLLRHTCEVNGADGIVLTKLDVLSEFEDIGIAVGYDCGNASATLVEQMTAGTPAYRFVKGWKTPIADCTSWKKLPKKARDYVTLIEKLCGTKVVAVATGPSRSSIIWR
jgi:adenylosuccinate synthase